MRTSKVHTATTVALRLLLTLAFIPPLLTRLQHQESWSQRFVRWGYPAWGSVAVAVVEIVALAALWVPKIGGYALAVLGIILLGAAYTWLANGPRGAAALPLALLVLVGSLAWLRVRTTGA